MAIDAMINAEKIIKKTMKELLNLLFEALNVKKNSIIC